MFSNCEKFNSDLSKWDVHNGEKFDKMFYGCDSFNADLSEWNVSNAKTWLSFAKKSLLKEYPERIPEKFIRECL
jgi:surface protein